MSDKKRGRLCCQMERKCVKVVSQMDNHLRVNMACELATGEATRLIHSSGENAKRGRKGNESRFPQIPKKRGCERVSRKR